LANKKGVMFFTVDALMAGVIFTFTIVLLLSFVLSVPASVDAKYYIDGYVDYVSNTKMSQFKDTYSFIYFDANEQNPDLFVYQKILLMKNQGYSDEFICSFVANFTNVVVPGHVGVEYRIDDDLICDRHQDRQDKADIYLSTTILTFVVDENQVMHGPNVTKLSVWV
jgi:hypothetical protein